MKKEALACVQDWLGGVAASAGAGSRYDARVLSGAVGALESLIEVELEMPGGLADLQAFFGALPREDQASWSRRIQPFLSGRTRWEVFQEVSATAGPGAAAAAGEAEGAEGGGEEEDEEGGMPVFDWGAGGLTLAPQPADAGDGAPEVTEEEVTESGLVKPTAEDFRTILEAEPDPGWITGKIDLSGLKNLRGYEGER